MVKAYSEDFRQKVMDYVLKGNSQKEASLKFDISINTVGSWHRRYKKEGHYNKKPHLGKSGKVSDEDFCRYVDENPDKTLVQIGEHFDLTDATICYHLKRLKYRYKKKSQDTKKPAWKKEMPI